MIAKKIYEGASAKDLGIPKIQYESRVKTLNEFLEGWNGENFEESFLEFISVQRVKSTPANETKRPIRKEENKSNIAKLRELARSLNEIAKSGIKVCSKQVHKKRFNICSSCEYLINGRCGKCGCFMRVKTKFAAMRCPIGLWEKQE